MLTITVNKKEYDIPADFGSSEAELLEAIDYPAEEYKCYRTTPKQGVHDEDDRVGDPAVVDDGDMFVVVPKYITGG